MELDQELFELEQKIETASKQISKQRFASAVKKSKGWRVDFFKTVPREESTYVIPLPKDTGIYLLIHRYADGSLGMWQHDCRTDGLGVSLILAQRYQPVIKKTLELLELNLY